MKLAEINELLDIFNDDSTQNKHNLQSNKRCYYHYEHGYIHLLVSRWLTQFNNSPFHKKLGKVATVNDFKNSRYARWQHTALIKQWLASHGGRNAVLKPLPHLGLVQDTKKTKNKQEFNSANNPMGYAITLDKWGSEDSSDIYWNQTSRLGYNLVVQLNLPLEVLRIYEQMKIDNPADNCQMGCHPSHKKRMTLAWARLDIDLENNQVLIEEIQSDWVGELMWSIKRAEKVFNNTKEHPQGKRHLTTFYYSGNEVRCQHYLKNMKGFYEQYKNTWANMILTATLEFIWKEIGADMQVFYHQFAFGCKLKGCTPPRSLYTAVPEKLGFKVSDIMPNMLTSNRQTQKRIEKIKRQHPDVDLRFYRLA